MNEIIEKEIKRYPLNTFSGETQQQLIDVLISVYSAAYTAGRAEALKEVLEGLPEEMKSAYGNSYPTSDCMMTFNGLLAQIKSNIEEIK